MELGELLYMVSQRIIGVTEAEFNKANLPRSMQPIVIDSVRAYFLREAYDNAIAVKLAQQYKMKTEDPEKRQGKRSGEGLDSLKQSLDQDFGKRGEKT